MDLPATADLSLSEGGEMYRNPGLTEISAGNVKWLNDLYLDEEFLDLMNYSPGSNIDAHYYILHRWNKEKEETEILGYLTELIDRDKEQSLNLYKPAGDIEEVSRDYIMKNMESNCVGLYESEASRLPGLVFQLNSKKIYIPANANLDDGELSDISYKEIGDSSLCEILEDMCISGLYSRKLMDFYDLNLSLIHI